LTAYKEQGCCHLKRSCAFSQQKFPVTAFFVQNVEKVKNTKKTKKVLEKPVKS